MMLISILLASLLVFSPLAECCGNHLRGSCKTLAFYLHDTIYTGDNDANATSVTVASPAAWANRPNFFGDTVVFDSPLTLGSDLRSEPIGRAQGIYSYSGKDSLAAWIAFSFILDTADHRGTINCIGYDAAMQNMRDIPVTGGTGDFLMARGIATFTTQVAAVYTRLRVDVKLYECY